MKIRITQSPRLKKYQITGNVDGCPEGYESDGSGNCIPKAPQKFQVNALSPMNVKSSITNILSGKTSTTPQIGKMPQFSFFPGITGGTKLPGATYDPKTGMIDSSKGFVTQQDTRDLGFSDSGKYIKDEAANLQNTFNTGTAKEIKQGISQFNQDFGTNLKNPNLITFGAKGRETAKKIGDISEGVQTGIAVASAATDFITNKQNIKEMKDKAHIEGLSDNVFNPITTEDRGDYVQTGTDYGMLRPDQYVVNKGMYRAEQGGENPNTMKIRIVSRPSSVMEYGGQSDYGLDLGRKDVYTDMPESKSDSVSNTISSVPREMANIEAEGGETVYGDLDMDGILEHMNISGPRHTQGGVPLNVPEGSFIFSDTAKMRIKDSKILEYFGLSEKKGGYTPAEIAKKYNINKYKAIIDDPNADELNKNTAQLMLNNYTKKLSLLAVIQEAMKGFPQGLPNVAKQQETAMVKYGGSLSEYQKGGTGGGTRVAVWDEDEQKALQEYIKQKYNVEIPINARDTDPKSERFTLPSMQTSRGGRRVYGDEDWTSAENMADFVKRQKKFIAENPNWDPTKPGATEKFQRWYDAERAKKGMKPYFGKGQRFQEYDDKFGEYTFSAPDIEPTQIPVKNNPVIGFKCQNVNGRVVIVPSSYNSKEERAAAGAYASQPEAEVACAETIPPGKVPPGKKGEIPPKYWKPDDWGLIGAALYPPKKYSPYMAPLSLEVAEPTFYDPNRELAANAEQMNIMTQGLSNFGSPQGFMANVSSAQGKALENAADIMSRYNNLNVGVANQFGPMQSQIRNQNRMYNADRATQLYDKNVIAAQQFDNARRQYVRGIINAAQNRFGNRMYMDMINKVNPIYNVNPRTGLSYYKEGWDWDKLGGAGYSSGASDWDSISRAFLEAKKKPGLENMTLNDFFRVSLPRTSATDSNNDGLPDNTRFSGVNPSLLNNMLIQSAQVFPQLLSNILGRTNYRPTYDNNQ
jgi:hypothetical protein